MGKFVIKQTKNGGYSFVLKAGNGEVIGNSEVYGSLAACKNGVESVKKVCTAHVEDQTIEGFETLKHPKFEIYKDKKGEVRFRLKAVNGEIILTGEGYSSKAGCKNGVDSIGRNAPDAPVEVEE